jgi:hypothetical protein
VPQALAKPTDKRSSDEDWIDHDTDDLSRISDARLNSMCARFEALTPSMKYQRWRLHGPPQMIIERESAANASMVSTLAKSRRSRTETPDRKFLNPSIAPLIRIQQYEVDMSLCRTRPKSKIRDQAVITRAVRCMSASDAEQLSRRSVCINDPRLNQVQLDLQAQQRRLGDRAAGAIKSGGTTRRAAKMVIVDTDHHIEQFTNWKVVEEQKVAALVTGSRISQKHLKAVLKACV